MADEIDDLLSELTRPGEPNEPNLAQGPSPAVDQGPVAPSPGVWSFEEVAPIPAGATAIKPEPVQAPPSSPSNRGRVTVGVVALVAVFVGAVVASFLIGASRSSNTTDEADRPAAVASETVSSDSSPEVDEAAAPTTSTLADEGDLAAEDSESTVDGDGAVDAIEDNIDPLTGEPFPESIADLSLAELRESNYPRSVALADGSLALRGRVGTQEQIDDAIDIIESVGGTAVNELVLTPGFPQYERGRIFLENFVLFEFNSIALAPEFIPLLDGTLPAFEVLPDLVVTVVGFADPVGPADVNLQISEQRAQAVADYWIEKGVAPERIIVEARGESVSADDDEQTPIAGDRRVEFLMDFGS